MENKELEQLKNYAEAQIKKLTEQIETQNKTMKEKKAEIETNINNDIVFFKLILDLVNSRLIKTE